MPCDWTLQAKLQTAFIGFYDQLVGIERDFTMRMRFYNDENAFLGLQWNSIISQP